jgi:(+)-neomenthol dehydrogenase
MSFLSMAQYFISEELRLELNDVDKLTEERLDEVLDAFMKDFTAGAAEANGWPVGFSAYKVAKAAVNAYTRILVKKQPGLRVKWAHPGFVKTDLNKLAGLLTPEQGASNVVKGGAAACRRYNRQILRSRPGGAVRVMKKARPGTADGRPYVANTY